MNFFRHRCFVLVLLVSVNGNVVPDGESAQVVKKSLFAGNEERSLQEEIFQELNHLSARKQRQIFDDLEKQLDGSQKSFVLSEPDHLSPLNVDELKSIHKTIKNPTSSLPPIRSKRTLNFLLSLVARAMGYTLTPTNPDAEWLPRQRPRPPAPSPSPPCTVPPTTAPCTSPPTAAPCTAPPTTPPCRGAVQTSPQLPTLPPNQIDANTIGYPFRPARTIPLLNFAPLPQGVLVPYPPLFQAQRANPPQPPCGTTPAPTTPAPCGTTPAPRPPPCATTPAPRPPPCATTPAPTPPPCAITPAPRPPPCATTPAPSPPPCSTPPPTSPCATTPAPTPPPCTAPAPSPPSSGTTPASLPPPPSPKPSNTPKKSLLLEYDDPVRIQIFSNDRKFLPASGNVYSGHEDGYEENLHSYFFPTHGDYKKKDEDVEDEEIQEEHVEEEEEEEEVEERPSGRKQENGNLKQYEEEDERSLARNEDEEDESETSLSIVEKPTAQNKQRRRMLPSKKEEKKEKGLKMKKPKRKKWVRIVKKQRRKTSTGSDPQETPGTPDAEISGSGPRLLGRRVRERPFDSFDFADSGKSAGNSKRVQLKKVIIDDEDIAPRDPGAGAYDLNINPFATESETERRKRLEQAVEKYVEDYVEKQLGAELIKNSGVPKTTVFEFAPKNGPKIQTITTTVAKATRGGGPGRPRSRQEPSTLPSSRQTANSRFLSSFDRNPRGREDAGYESFSTRS